MTRRALVVGLVMLVAACRPAAPAPVAFDSEHEACRFCRMVGSSGRFAAQLQVPGEDALYFDDLGCLRSYLAGSSPSADASVFVIDHRTGTWTDARAAVYVRHESVATPMGSHLLAFTSAASRDADPDSTGGVPVAAADVLGGLARRGGGS